MEARICKSTADEKSHACRLSGEVLPRLSGSRYDDQEPDFFRDL